MPSPCCSWPPVTGHWPLPLDGRAVPALPCAGGHPPQRPPVAMPPCVRRTSLSPAPAMRSHRACTIPACRRRAVDTTPPCVRGSRSSNPESRIANPESRIANPELRPSRAVGPFRPSLGRGDTPRNAPLTPLHRPVEGSNVAMRNSGAMPSPCCSWPPATSHRPPTTGHCRPHNRPAPELVPVLAHFPPAMVLSAL